MRVQLGVVFTIIGSFTVLGCGPSNEIPVYPISGMVKYAGKPIGVGTIVFDPVDGEGPSAMGSIANGEITAKVIEGEMILRFSAVETLDKKDQYGEWITVSSIPDKYNLDSEIRRTVSPNVENYFEIELE